MRISRGKGRVVATVLTVAFVLVAVVGTLAIVQRTTAKSLATGHFSVSPSVHGTTPLWKTVNLSSVPLVLPTGHQIAPHLSYYPPARLALLKQAALHTRSAPSGHDAQLPGAVTPQTPSPTGSLQGQSENGSTPSDMGFAVGGGYIVQVINQTIAVYNTGGKKLYGPTAFYTFLGLSSSSFLYDPRAVYDAVHSRFIILIDDAEGAPFNTNRQNSTYHIAVSTTGNPTSTYHLYTYTAGQGFGTSNANWADFPQMGIDAQALYFSGNRYGFNPENFSNAFVFAVNLAQLEAGTTPAYWEYSGVNETGGQAFTIAPAITYGTPRAEFMIDTSFNIAGDYTVWSLSNPFSGISSYTPVLEGYTFTGPMFTTPPAADQPGSSGLNSIDSGDPRVGGQVVFRNGLLYVALTTGYVNSASNNVAAIIWLEVRPVLSVNSTHCIPNSDCSDLSYANFYDFSTLGYGLTISAYDPSIAVDSDGNFFLDYTVSSATSEPYGLVNSHRITDPSRTTGAAASVPGSFSAALYTQNRWGDYSAIALDPSGCANTGIVVNCYKVWFSGMYVLSTGNWSTYISSDAESILQP